MEQIQTVDNSTKYSPIETYDEFIKRFNVGDLTLEQKQRLALVKIEKMRLERDNPLAFYNCYRNPQQLKFHQSNKKIRFIIGGNRSGKTISGTVESIWYTMGTHPFRKVSVPNSGWIVSLDFSTSRDVAELMIKKWTSRKWIKRWYSADRILEATTGSIIGFKSCDSGAQKFQGTKKDWVSFDEQPDYLVWQECYMRTIDSGGMLWCAMTPTEGMSWVYDEIYEQRTVNPDIEVIEMSMRDNPWLSKEAIDKAELTMSPEEKRMRIEGKFVQFSGLILKNFNDNVHIIPSFPMPKKARHFRGIDHGENNPTACLWLFCIPSTVNEEVEEYYVYDEYYEIDKDAQTNARNIKEMSGGVRYNWSIIDPSTNHRTGVGHSIRQIYTDNGIITRLGNNDHDALRGARDTIRQLLEVDVRTGRPRLFIFNTCFNTIKEIIRWRYKSYRGKYEKNLPDEPAKVSDHTMQALCYIIQGNPHYYTETDNIPEPAVWYH